MNAKLQPAVLKWARLRAGLDEKTLSKRLKVPIGVLQLWETTGSIPSVIIQKLADKTFTPYGFLFLQKPPEEKLPISDFRRVAKGRTQPSPELLDVIYRCQSRQQWYREYLISHGELPSPFVRSIYRHTPVEIAAASIRNVIAIGSSLSLSVNDADEALRRTIENIEDAGILVSRTGFAGSSTRRKLSVDEFRGFALCDEYAPLIFVNGADVHAAQMFTLAHELVHIWLGESAVFNLSKTYSDGHALEVFCNDVAAELLLPLAQLKREWTGIGGSKAEITRLARKYKVSRIVVARRAHDAHYIDDVPYGVFYNGEVNSEKKAKGGNYYLTKPYEASRRLSVALIRDAKNGRTLLYDAMQLLGIKTYSTFENYANNLQLSA